MYKNRQAAEKCVEEAISTLKHSLIYGDDFLFLKMIRDAEHSIIAAKMVIKQNV